jgi:hypothetical protein
VIRIGLRFDRRDAEYLRTIARQIRSGQRSGETVGGITLAADAAETGEPLIVQCESAQEAKQMAARFVRLGCTMPAIEELTGLRPAQ